MLVVDHDRVLADVPGAPAPSCERQRLVEAPALQELRCERSRAFLSLSTDIR